MRPSRHMLIHRARRLRVESTEAEKVLWSRLRRRQVVGVRFRRQHPVEPYILDFYAPSIRLCIELDGGQHAEQAERDARRDAYLEGQGIRVLRFHNQDVLKHVDGVVEVILEAISGNPL